MSVKVKTKLFVEGLNLNDVAKCLSASGFCVSDMHFEGKNRLCFCVYDKDCKKVLAYLKKKCYNVKVIGRVGFGSLSDFFKKHIAAFVLMVACLFFCILSSNFCGKVSVTADDDIRDAVVAAAYDYGAKKGVKMSNISLDGLENYICSHVEGIKYALAKKRGNVLYLSVVKRDIAAPPVDLSKPKDLIAAFDGVVTSVLTLNGTPLVSVGDNVKKGQILIKGVTTFLDGTTEPITAQGSVYATAQVIGSALFCPLRTDFEYTGSVAKRRYVKIGKYVSDYSKKIDYEFFDKETTTKYLYPLGICVVFEKLRQLSPVTREVTLEEQTPVLQIAAYEDALKKSGADKTAVIDVKYGIKKAADKIFVQATLYYDTKISVYGG